MTVMVICVDMLCGITVTSSVQLGRVSIYATFPFSESHTIIRLQNSRTSSFEKKKKCEIVKS